MSYLTKYGSFWGQIPLTTGKTIWVAPSASYTVEGQTYNASDGNDGLSPERALLTLNQAVTNATESVGDVIVLLPGAHSWSATQTLSKAGVTITGIPRGNPMNSTRGAASGVKCPTSVTSTGHILTPTAADIHIAHLHFIPAVGFAAIKPSAVAHRLLVHDCTYNATGTGNTATIGLDCTWTGTSAYLNDVTIRNCFFYNEGANGPAVYTQGTCNNMVVESSTIFHTGASTWVDAVKVVSTNVGMIFRDVDIISQSSGTVMTDGIDIAGATTDGAVTILRCFFPVGATNGLTNANVADNQCAENYTMQAAASVGGTLILST